MEDSIFTIQTLVWIMHQPVMITLYTFVIITFILEKFEEYSERKIFMKRYNKALHTLFNLKSRWIAAKQMNILCGLDFMDRSFNKGFESMMNEIKTNPESVETHMNELYEELLSMYATPSAKIALDEVFQH